MDSNAVLVVGAGASKEYDLPLGTELKAKIANLFDFEFQHSQTPTKGDRLFFDALALHQPNFPRQVERINQLLQTGRVLQKTLPQAPSIDQFIFNRSGDMDTEIVGKLAIARAILDAEGKSSLNQGFPDRYSPPTRDFLSWNVGETWLPAFFTILIDRCDSLDAVANRLSRIKVISFNYDRVIKHYLHGALQNYFPDRSAEVVNAMLQLEVIHPYGSLGPLEWEDSKNGLAFGRPVDAEKLGVLAGQLKTFNESVSEDLRESARIVLKATRTVMFLGFGFHKQNIDFLQAYFKADTTVFGTASGFSEFDRSEIAREIAESFNIGQERVHLFDGHCSTIFQHYSRALKLNGI